MKLTIEVKLVCVRCEASGWQSDHKTTSERCGALLGFPCNYPDEHHVKPKRRLRVSVRRG